MPTRGNERCPTAENGDPICIVNTSPTSRSKSIDAMAKFADGPAARTNSVDDRAGIAVAKIADNALRERHAIDARCAGSKVERAGVEIGEERLRRHVRVEQRVHRGRPVRHGIVDVLCGNVEIAEHRNREGLSGDAVNAVRAVDAGVAFGAGRSLRAVGAVDATLTRRSAVFASRPWRAGRPLRPRLAVSSVNAGRGVGAIEAWRALGDRADPPESTPVTISVTKTMLPTSITMESIVSTAVGPVILGAFGLRNCFMFFLSITRPRCLKLESRRNHWPIRAAASWTKFSGTVPFFTKVHKS